MSTEQAGTKKAGEKKPIQVLRERRGGVPKELLERSRAHTKTRKKILQALKDGPKTVPEVAKATAMPSHEVLWRLMGMKKYGLVVEGGERDGYYEYALTKE
jgi:predicted transcriptional regulator